MRALLLAVMFGVVGLMQSRTAVAQANSARETSFEVASIRPGNPNDQHHDYMWEIGRFETFNIRLHIIIEQAYDIDANQLVGLPSWAYSSEYTIHAEPWIDVTKVPWPQREALQDKMVQSLPADRFRLKFHWSTKQLPVYDLVVAKGGPKLEQVTEADLAPHSKYRQTHRMAGGIEYGPGAITVSGAKFSDFVNILTNTVGRHVLDKTGLNGAYAFKLKWTPSPGADTGTESGSNPGGAQEQMPASVDFSSHAVTVFIAIKQQLGLELKSAKGAVKVLVVDHVEPPTPN